MKYGVFDIESRNWIDFEILGAFDGREYRTFTDVPTFLSYLDRKDHDGFIWYAHNGGKFDVLFILEELLNRGQVRKIIDRSGRVIQLKCEGKRAAWEIRDSFALLPASLKELATTFDVAHKKMDFQDYSKISKRSKKTLEYLENDVFALYEVIEAFQNLSYVHDVQLTVASQALHTFRTQFLHGDLEMMALPDEQLVREHFYSGGRVEVFKGWGTVNSYDVNSLFPYAMIQEMPCGEVRHVRTFRPGLIGFYKVNVKKAPENNVGLFLYKDSTGKNFYVNGPGTYYLSSASIEYLKSVHGIQCDVESGIVFTRREYLFNEYVDAFYSMKQKEKKGSALYLLSKLMLNSLYGKLGAKRIQEMLILDDGTIRRYALPDPILSGYGLVIVEKDSRSKFILPYLAAYITDLARLHHLKLMMQAPDAMFYCDTDSLYTTASYKKECGTTLGTLSDTGRWHGVFIAPKTYGLKSLDGKEEHIAFKGFRSEDFSFAQLERALFKKTVLIQERDRVLSYKECLRRESEVARDRGLFLKLVKQRKEAALTYDRRLTIPNKKHIFITRPFTYAEINSHSKKG